MEASSARPGAAAPGARWPGPPRWLGPVAVTAGVVTVLLVPDLRVPVMFLYLILVTAETATHSLRRGLQAVVVALAGTVVADLVHGVAAAAAAPSLLGFAVAAAALPVLVARLTARHRAHTQHLSRLHAALRTLAGTPDLGGTIEAIGETAKQAVGAKLVSVMRLDEGSGRLYTASVTEVSPPATRPVPEEPRLVRTLPAGGPSELAVTTGRPVVVDDFSADARFGAWAGVAEQQGVAAMVAVPLIAGETTVGTLNAYWQRSGHPPQDDIALLVAYAEAAALSILRADAYEQQRRAATSLREAERMKSEFTAAVTHELRTPLTTVLGFIETMLLHEDRLSDEDRRRMLEVSRRNAVDLSHRISSLLEFSKLEAEHATVMPHPQPLGPALATALDNCAGLLAEHELTVDVDRELIVDLDELALDHIVANLISNAVKYSPSGTRIEITTTVAADSGEAVVSVRDHGTGIAAPELPFVFERFYRGADRGRGRNGTGIGLAIVERYVSLGGGRVWVESAEGSGTTFRFSLPLAEAHAPLVAEESRDGPGDPAVAASP